MIADKCFTKEYILEQKETFGTCDPGLIEKAIYALALLGNLAESELSFVFKGGTALLLHLPIPKRLSIDIDIMCMTPESELTDLVEKLSLISPFIRSKESIRGERGLPDRRHFKFFFNSAIQKQEAYILLDVVHDKCGLDCAKKQISTSFIEVERELLVNTLTIDSLVADKLTAFAPNTIGVPFRTKKGNSMTMQVVKQLFDVGELFNEIKSLEKVKHAYSENFEQENRYHDDKFSIKDILSDTANTSLQLCMFDIKGAPLEAEIIDNLKDGISRISSHLIQNKFRIHIEAKIAAAKAYLLIQYLSGKIDLHVDQLVYDIEKIKDITIETQTWMNRLRGIVPEAFYFLALAENSL